MMQQYGVILKIILSKLCSLLMNLTCCNILILLTMTGTTVRHWTIVINNVLKYKSISGLFWKYCYNTKLIYLMKKLCINISLVYGMKLQFTFWCSSLQPCKLHVKLLTELVASCSRHHPTHTTNVWAKAKPNAATKMLQTIPAAIT